MAYIIDQYVHPQYDDDTVNVNCVMSWQRTRPQGSEETRLKIDYQNGFFTESGAAWERHGGIARVMACLSI
jgi:hypothetical protein